MDSGLTASSGGSTVSNAGLSGRIQGYDLGVSLLWGFLAELLLLASLKRKTKHRNKTKQ